MDKKLFTIILSNETTAIGDNWIAFILIANGRLELSRRHGSDCVFLQAPRLDLLIFSIAHTTTTTGKKRDAMEELALQFKGQTLALALPNGTDTTVGQLQDAIAQLVHVAPDAQRLFHSKRRVDVSDAAQLVVDVCDGLPQSPTLLLLAGASIEEIEQMKETQSAVAAQQHIRYEPTALKCMDRMTMLVTDSPISPCQ